MRLPDAIDFVRPSIVQIRSSGDDSSPLGERLGTGFLVTPRHVVTAKHVVDAANAAVGQKVHVAFAGPTVDTAHMQIRGAFIGTDARVAALAPKDDLALLEVPGAVHVLENVTWGDSSAQAPPTPARLSPSNVREGTAVAVSGYPLDEPSLVTNAGVLASSFSLVQEGGNYEERHLGDLTANPGNSGGPVYTVVEGTVFGVCVAGRLTPVVGGVGSHAAGPDTHRSGSAGHRALRGGRRRSRAGAGEVAKPKTPKEGPQALTW